MELSQVFLGLLIGVLLQGANTNSEEIRGIPGVDYPTFFEIPATTFRCSDQKYIPGFYADPEASCQVFHYCYKNRQESYLCPTGTTFNQAILACDYWYNSDCAGATSLYEVNNNYQSRVLANDFKSQDASNTFEGETSTYEQITSSAGNEVPNAIPKGKDINQVISNVERVSNENHSNKAADNRKTNAGVKNKSYNNRGYLENPKNLEFLRRQESLAQDSEDGTLVLDEAMQRNDEYSRHGQIDPSSGPELRPLINSSESVYEKLAELYDTDSRFSANENAPEYTEEQLRSLVEEIRDYEHEMLSKKDENYMFRPTKDTNYFSGLYESELNSKLMEYSRKHDSSKLNDGENESIPESKYDDQADSNANEDRVNYLHKIRMHDFHPSYAFDSKHMNEERSVIDSNQQSELSNNKDFTMEREKPTLVPDSTERFSKRFSIMEENETKKSRRNPVYVVAESVSEAPKLPSLRKRPRGYPFGIQKAADLENSSVAGEIVANKASNPVVEESEVNYQNENLFSSPGSGDLDLNHDATEYIDEEQKELFSNGQIISLEEYDSKYSSEIGSPQESYPEAIKLSDKNSRYVQNQNSLNFVSKEYDLNPALQDQWNNVGYSGDGFSDAGSKIKLIQKPSAEDMSPSHQEFESPLPGANVAEVPELSNVDSLTRMEEYSEESFDTLHPPNTLNQLRANTRNLYFVDYSGNEDTDIDAEPVYQENIPLNSIELTDQNNYNGNMKVVGALYEPVSDETSDMYSESLRNDNDEMTDSINYETDVSEEEQNENSLRKNNLQSSDSKEAYVDFGTIPQSIYISPEGNTFYYIDSKMPRDQKNVDAVTPNVAELYFKNRTKFTNANIADSFLRSENINEDVQSSGSGILESQPGMDMEETLATNIMKMTDTDFTEFVNSPEFSEVTHIPLTQTSESDLTGESEETHSSYADQNEYHEGLIDSSQNENAEFDYSTQSLSMQRYPQNVYTDPEGNMFLYIDSETSKEPKYFAPSAPTNSEFHLEYGINSRSTDNAETRLSENSVKGCPSSGSDALESRTDTDSESYVENIMKMSDAEFNKYVNSDEFFEVNEIPGTDSNEGYSDKEGVGKQYLKHNVFIDRGRTSNLIKSQNFYVDTNVEDSEALRYEIDESLSADALQKRVNSPDSEENFSEENSDLMNQTIYEDSEGNMFYYIDTPMPEDSENLDVAALDSDASISPSEMADVEGQFSPSSSYDGDKPITGMDETIAKNIMQMSDLEFKEYLGSQEFSEVTDTPNTQCNEHDPMNEENSRWGNQAFNDFKDMSERLESSVDVSDEIAPKMPNHLESFDSYLGTDGNDFSIDNQETEYSGIFSEGTFQKRKKKSNSRKHGSKKRKSYVNQNDMITDAQGNIFYYYYDTAVPEDQENGKENFGSMSRSAFDPDFSPERADGQNYFHAPDGRKQLGEAYAKNIMEMSDSDFKEYLNSQEFSEVTDIPETRNDGETYAEYNEQRWMNQGVAEIQDDTSDHFRPLIEAADETAKSIPNEYKQFNSRFVKRNKELSSDLSQSDDASLNDEQEGNYESEAYEELIAEDNDDSETSPQNVFVDSEGNMFYFVSSPKASDHSQNQHFTFEAAEETELNLESALNSSGSAEINTPLEKAVTVDENSLLNIHKEQSDPASEEAFLQNIMKLSDAEFSAFINSREFKAVTDTPDIPYNEESKSRQNCSKTEPFIVGDGVGEEFRSNLEKPGQFESPDSRSMGKGDSIPGLNVFQSGIQTQNPVNAEVASTGSHASKTLHETNQIVSHNMNDQTSVHLNSETAVESIDLNNAQDEVYGDFSDLFAALTKEPDMKDKGTSDNLKVKGTEVQEKTSFTDIPPKGVKSSGYPSSKSSLSEMKESIDFKQLHQPSSNLARGLEAHVFTPSNLRPADAKTLHEFPQSSQHFNSLQFQRDFEGASNQQYQSSPQQLVKKSLPQPKRSEYTPSKTPEPTFGGTLGSMKKSKLQMLGVYAKALRQRLF